MNPVGKRTILFASILASVAVLLVVGILVSSSDNSMPGKVVIFGRDFPLPFGKKISPTTRQSPTSEEPAPTMEYSKEQKAAIERLKSLGY